MLRKPSTRPNERHVQKWFFGPRLGLPMIRGRQKCPASGSEPQRTPTAPHRPPASAQCRTCKGPCTLAGGSPRARATCRACLASPDASRRALSGLGRTASPRDRSREREARTCAIASLLHSPHRRMQTCEEQQAKTERGEGEGGGARAAWCEGVTVPGSSDHQHGPTRPRGGNCTGAFGSPARATARRRSSNMTGRRSRGQCGLGDRARADLQAGCLTPPVRAHEVPID